MLELKHFRLVEAIHRTGSVSGAARDLGYSQPAASQQLRQLERIVRTPVIIRVGRKTRLTQAGEVLLAHGPQALSAVQRAMSEIELIAGLQGGELTLTAFPSASATIVPIALAEFRRRHPRVAVRLIEQEAHAAVRQLASGDADLAVIGQFYSSGSELTEVPADWVTRTILEEEVFVALPKSHAAADQASVALSDLAGEAWVAGCEECRANLIEVAAVAGFTPRITLETDDYVALQRLAAAGLGVALISGLMLEAARADPGLALRPIRPRRRRRISTVTTPTAMRVPGIAELLMCLQQAGTLVTREPSTYK
ncbi:MAG: LysR family transcriptional regulator [Tessaracoccus sp.]|uniref:LysR family transcriptional regulator n=1 Tax=Tessaracoccus sp. TaxID=1971211 RepID=UPI001EB3DE2E|nr:LysR family transcriptional regulator [Tessaracoccus sp.]MBK7820284.1 LysR family transcriptional regulator [Tessaracoccus sp.]